MPNSEFQPRLRERLMPKNNGPRLPKRPGKDLNIPDYRERAGVETMAIGGIVTVEAMRRLMDQYFDAQDGVATQAPVTTEAPVVTQEPTQEATATQVASSPTPEATNTQVPEPTATQQGCGKQYDIDGMKRYKFGGLEHTEQTIKVEQESDVTAKIRYVQDVDKSGREFCAENELQTHETAVVYIDGCGKIEITDGVKGANEGTDKFSCVLPKGEYKLHVQSTASDYNDVGSINIGIDINMEAVPTKTPASPTPIPTTMTPTLVAPTITPTPYPTGLVTPENSPTPPYYTGTPTPTGEFPTATPTRTETYVPGVPAQQRAMVPVTGAEVNGEVTGAAIMALAFILGSIAYSRNHRRR